MRDLCQVCSEFKKCPFGEGNEIDPTVRQEEWDDATPGEKSKPSGCWEVVECDLFQDMNKKKS